MSSRAVLVGWALALALGVSGLPARAEVATDVASRRDGGAQELARRTGDFVTYGERPTLPGEQHACSFRHALCVHAAWGASREILALLDAADRAWDVATGALALPAPDPAAETRALDLYLVDGEAYASRTWLDGRDPASVFDRAHAFALVGRGVRVGCRLDGVAARVVARAILMRVAPATPEGTALAQAAAAAALMVPCATGTDAGQSAFQAHPEVGLASSLAPPVEQMPLGETGPLAESPRELYSEGLALFYDWLDASFGRYPGAIVQALWAASATRTAPNAARWNDEPDTFDVLRESFKGALTTGSTVDDLWLDFAVARAFVPGLPVRTEWDVAWPTAPRTLLSGHPVAPTGAAYVAIDCAGRPPSARLRVEARWEELAHMLWTLVRMDAEGKELSRVSVTGTERGTSAQATLVDLDGVRRVLLVGVNAGDPRRTVDPDAYRLEPHGWMVSLGVE